ncbi:MAG TPA: (p)ppGpp synthetase [Dehalococcoidia bacterium]|nr:(p)ppGpp synthetase [Dehalococcoidia bacterium]
MDAKLLLEKAGKYLPKDKLLLIESAYTYAMHAHQGQQRESGEPYFEHPYATAMTLADLQLDAQSLAAALLHDVTEDCNIPIEKIEEKFGTEVAKLVDGVTKLNRLSWRGQKIDDGVILQAEAENLRKMLIAMAEDLRVVFIKLADRLHNMHTLGALPAERQFAIARETLDIYAPLAHRLGMWQVKWQLEDLSFRYLDPQQYHKIAGLVSTKRNEREGFINEAVDKVKEELAKDGIKAEVFGRPKHIFSIYNKINKYAAQGKDFDDIHDLFAIRALVDSVPDCYKALGIIHNLWHPLPEEFNDYIANPKYNGYQSLHTTVLSMGATPLEIQIRTYEMQRIADYGVAAHWRYKEGVKQDQNFDEKLAWLRQFSDWQSELGSEEFMASLKTDFFIDQVFVFTPKGEIKALPKGATPLDFAYRIHTEMGHRCIGAKVNGKLVPLNHELKNGDIIEIMTTKAEKAPSLDWLNSSLGYVRTSHAQQKIRQWFNKQGRTQNIERGKTLFEKEIKRLGGAASNVESLAHSLNYATVDDFYIALGTGGVTAHQLAIMLSAEEPEEEIPVSVKPSAQAGKKVVSSGVQIQGVGDLLTHMANCCHPVPGDDIIGYITRSHGISIHRKDCVNIINEQEKERLIEASWGPIEDVYPVRVRIEAWNRVGVLRDISTLIAEEKVNISSINTVEREDTTSIFITLEIKNMAELAELLTKIHGLRGVISAVRSNQTKAAFGS